MLKDIDPEIQVSFCVITVNGKYLLMLRDNNPNIPQPNIWAPFGGRLEANEDPRAGLIRELNEETNLDASDAEFLGSMKVVGTIEEANYHIFHLDATSQMEKFKRGEGQAHGFFDYDAVKNISAAQKTKDFVFMHRLREIRKGKKIAMCHGVFDVLHHDHVRLFDLARQTADYVMVSMVADRFVDKGLGRPIVKEQDRAFMLSALRNVDHVIITHSLYPFDNIRCFAPDFYIHGKTENELPEDKLLDDLGIEVVVRKDGHNEAKRKTSSSYLIERNFK